MEDPPDVETLVSGLVAENEGARKYAVFKLQSLLGDPSFADIFIQGDGHIALRQAALEATGNTQAYALGSLDALLELDVGWDAVDEAVIDKAVELAVTHPLVNIVRNALTLLVLIVSRPLRDSRRESAQGFGFQAIKPALDHHPGFLDSLVQRLSASDHTLCANALQLVNALMRDAVIHGGENEWPKFIKRLQDLGVIGGVGMLMRGDAASDLGSPLAGAILEFQGLTKVLLRKWRQVRVNLEVPEQKRALKTIHLLSKPEPYDPSDLESEGSSSNRSSRRHHPRKWRRLGFETEQPMREFEDTGYLGMMDLVDYARRNEDAYQRILMEQSVQPQEQRCPIARASISITLLLYEHFEIDDAADTLGSTTTAAHSRSISDYGRASNSYKVDKLYRPLLLQWGRLHTSATNTFQRMWKAAGAETEDFYKIEEVLRVIVERTVGAANRKSDVGAIEDELRSVTLVQARKWQMQGLDEVYEDAWGPHLTQVRDQLHQESQQFMKEQRIRCLLQGQWFPTATPTAGAVVAWRFCRLSHNRRWLHYQDFASKNGSEPALSDLPERIDLNTVTSVDSNVTANDNPLVVVNGGTLSTETLTAQISRQSTKTPQEATSTKITIMGTQSKSSTKHSSSSGLQTEEESVLLELFPQTSYVASEWLDGLLMLLNQEPITKDTTRLIDMMKDWGVRLRMLNLRWEDVDWEALEARVKGVKVEQRAVPTREGLDGEYYYAMAEA